MICQVQRTPSLQTLKCALCFGASPVPYRLPSLSQNRAIRNNDGIVEIRPQIPHSAKSMGKCSFPAYSNLQQPGPGKSFIGQSSVSGNSGEKHLRICTGLHRKAEDPANSAKWCYQCHHCIIQGDNLQSNRVNPCISK